MCKAETFLLTKTPLKCNKKFLLSISDTANKNARRIEFASVVVTQGSMRISFVTGVIYKFVDYQIYGVNLQLHQLHFNHGINALWVAGMFNKKIKDVLKNFFIV